MARMLVIAVAVGVMCAGCAQPAREGDPIRQVVATPTDEDRDALWSAAEDVLRENRFDIALVDRREGTISTKPTTSEHFFEFWRHDVATPYDFLEASLRTVRRSAVVKIEGTEGQTELTVKVERERFATPERQFNNSVAAFQMFREELPAEQTGRALTPADDYWIDAGRDLAMEQYLLNRIVKRWSAERPNG